MSLTTPYSEQFLVADGIRTKFFFNKEFDAISENYVKCAVYNPDGSVIIPDFVPNLSEGAINIVSLTMPDGSILNAPVDGAIVRIYRDVPEAQNTTVSSLQASTAKQIVNNFDNIVAMIQELQYSDEHFTVRSTLPQRDITVQLLQPSDDKKLIYWDNNTRRLVVTEFTKDEVILSDNVRKFKFEDDSLFFLHNGVWLPVITQADIDKIISTITAKDVLYENEQYPDMHNLQDAMDELLYVTPSVSITGGGTFEIGFTKATTTLNWTWNKAIKTQELNQNIGVLGADVRTYKYEMPITSNTTFTITGSDGKTTKSASTSVTFQPSRYWGVSANTSLTDAEIIALSSELSTTRTQSRTFNCSGGKYFYFVIRTDYCSGIKFKVGGLAFSDMKVETRNVVNAQGYSQSYNIYRVNNIQTGSAIAVEVL